MKNFFLYKKNIEKKVRLSPLLATSLIMLPLSVLIVFIIFYLFNQQTKLVFERREALSSIGATIVEQKLGAVVDIGNSFALRPLVYQNIEKGDWGEAIKNLERPKEIFPYINTVALFDKDGTLKARLPDVPGTVGKNFAAREYYQGVSKEWMPYVSTAFKSDAVSKISVIAVAVPIRSINQKVIGILVIGIRTDVILSWSKEVNVGSLGDFYILDKKGQLVASPDINPEDELFDYSSLPITQKLLQGEHGTDIFIDPVDSEEDLGAYTPVKKYGFGVIVGQPSRIAFSERNNLARLFLIIGLIIALSFAYFFYRIFRNNDVIKSQRDREELFLDSIGEGVVAIDHEWNVMLWNRAAESLTGWSRGDTLGKPIRSVVKFLREVDRTENYLFIEDSIASGNTRVQEKGLLLVKKDGKEFSVSCTAAPIGDNRGGNIGAIVVFRDITQENESEQLTSDFAYAAHQLRTPVTEALWNIEIAKDQTDETKRGENLDIAHDAIQSIKVLEEHLLLVSEIDRGVVDSQVEPVLLRASFEGMLKNLTLIADTYGVKINLDLSRVPAVINTDSHLLNRVLLEVIENAIVYNREGADVNFKAITQDENIIFEVSDKGVGILIQEQPIVFTKFFRGSNRGSKNPGTGLGLYIAKEYVKILKGKIWFNSIEREGTTFLVSIPMK